MTAPNLIQATEAGNVLADLYRQLAIANSALELIAAPMRPDGTWNRDREACRALAQRAIADMENSNDRHP